VLDLYRLFFSAHLVSNLTKALIFKGFEALTTSSQQSYPQIFGMTFKVLQNQALRPDFKTSPNPQNSPNHQKQDSFDHPILD
jgi:hypothetical protein